MFEVLSPGGKSQLLCPGASPRVASHGGNLNIPIRVSYDSTSARAYGESMQPHKTLHSVPYSSIVPTIYSAWTKLTDQRTLVVFAVMLSAPSIQSLNPT